MTVSETTNQRAPLENLEDLYQLSPMQQGMLFHSVYEPESGIYLEQSVFTIDGDLDVTAFERAWKVVLDRHSILRSSFVWEDLEKPLQVVHRDVVLPFKKQDWRNEPPEVQSQLLQEYLSEDRRRGFDLGSAPLLRQALFRTSDKAYKFIFSRHHIILDRWSRSIVLKDLFAFYESIVGKKELRPNQNGRYGDYISWLASQDLAAGEAYWRAALEGFNAPTPVTIEKAHNPTQLGKEFDEERLQLSEAITAQLRDFARQHKFTLNTLTQAAWAVLLGKYARETDVVFGVTVSGRPATLSGVESMVGLFINTLPLRVQLSPNKKVVDWLKSLQEQQFVLQQYEYCSLLDIQGWSEIPRGVPLFETILVFENLAVGSHSQTADGKLNVQSDRSYGSATGYPLTIIVSPGTKHNLQLVYDRARFSAETAKRMLVHLETVFEAIVANPERPLSEIELIGSEEKQRLLFALNETHTDYDREICVHQLIERQAVSNPSAVAVSFRDRSLTYGDLNARADQLARHLRSLGVGPDTLVGICIERSLEMIIGLLGILKAGGAYVPLDPKFPRDRLAFMIEDADLTVLVTQESLLRELPAHDATLVTLDLDSEIISQGSKDNVFSMATADNLAYVIYTSGSTGKPKGVAIDHRALTNFLLAVQRQPGLTGDDVLLAVTTLSFDISGLEIYLPLITGARVVIADAEVASDGTQLKQLIAKSQTTVMQATPATWQMLINAGWQGQAGLKVLCGGEALARELANDLVARAATVWNMYGPTETTVWSTSGQIEAGDETICIGRPIANTQIYLLDQGNHAVPVGIPGELHIGGDGLARGYWNHPQLAAEKFVPNIFNNGPNTRLYKTGDLARFTGNGNIEYLGRIDDQVKIRGYRIELGEIEAVLRQHSLVRQNVVIVREDNVGDKKLVAYVVMDDGEKQTSQELREFLRTRLPEYMLPAGIVQLNKLPLTPNGKVNRRALPAPDYDAEVQDAFVAPRNHTEELLARIWSEVLKVPRVGVNDNFFELGGHSLLAVSMISRVRDALSVDLKVRSLFEAPTVARLARTLDRSGKDASVPSITRVKRGPHLPLSFAQERLWFLDQLESESPFYNVPSAFRLAGSLDEGSLRRAFDAITMRHESLRTTFPLVDGKPVQLISSKSAVTFSSHDLTSLERSRVEVEIRQRGGDEARKAFDLQKGPLLRVELLRLAESEYVLLITTHHIVSDGWSIGILARELTALYGEFAFGRPTQIPELSVQYGDYAIWQREWLRSDLLEKQLSYWKRQLHGAPALLELPKDRPRPAVQTFNGARKSARLSHSLTKALNDLSRREGVTMFMTILAVYQTLLWRYSGQSDLVVGTPVAGRNSAELENLIGFFVNTLVMRSDLSANPTFQQLLSKVRETALEAYAHQDLPFERVVDAVQPERSLSHTPLFQVTLVFQNAPRERFDLGGLILHRIPAESRTSKFDLTLFATEAEGILNLAFEYNTDLFDDARIERMLEHLQTLIEAVVREPKTRIGRLEMLPEAERTQLLFSWNKTGKKYRRDSCLHELFEEQAEKKAAEIALVWGTEQLSYGELNGRANQLAHYLKRRGVGPEVLVGVCVKRSLEMVVGILGILKAGGAYVPLDPEYPEERLRFMLDDAKARLLLTQEPLLQQLPETSADLVCLDRDWEEISKESEANARGGAAAGNVAYVIYTSGSTGKPKGVAIEHRSAAALLEWAQEVFTAEELGGVLASTSICFDLSVFELFVPLSYGGKVFVADDVLELLTMAGAKDVRLVNTVPSAIVELLRLGGLPKSLETVNLAGEPLAASLVEQLYKRAHIKRVYDLYGPSEDTTYSTYALRVPAGRATIGRPISNTRTYLLDRTGQPVPIGVPGELYLGGAGLARGYLNRSELTAKVFVPDPFSGEAGARLYKTGDLARYLEDGTIEYLGRFDNQVKLRGFRIELGEIEEAIKKHPQVSEVIVLTREDEPGDKRLVAYVIPNRDASDLHLEQDLQVQQVAEWQALWNETYIARSQDPTFNIAGWNSSYSGEPIPNEEMHEWVDSTVDRILALRPSRVLEIGCGTGLLLFRIAPYCTHYHGTDLSKTALDCLRQQVSGVQPRLQNITLTEQTADDFGGIEAQAFDTVILNSVVQYFPSVDYMLRVLEGAAKCLKPGGTIFLGDVRNLPLLRALHTSVQVHQAPSNLPLSELQRRVEKRMAEEKELVIDPAFFTALQRHLPQISRVDIQLKRGGYQNELNKFRYDVVLHLNGEPVHRVKHTWLHWRRDRLSINKARRLLIERMPEIVAIRGVPDARLASDYKALTLLGSEAVLQTAAELREAVQRSDGEPAVDPEKFYALVKDLPYAVELTWATLAGDGTFDVVLRRRNAPYAEVIRHQSWKVDSAWGKYANDPLLGKIARKLESVLRAALRTQLPEYMAPSEFVFLTAFPITPNGKIDRFALPLPGQSRPELEQPYVAPQTEIEEELAGIWAEVLRRESVGVKDNFFELGGHSLLATQVVSRIREQFKLELPLRSMFESPTIVALARVVAELQQKTKRTTAPELKRRRPPSRVDHLTLEEVNSLLSKVLSKADLT
ncbi:MAG: amino acid adenylation domain-containing protein [Pyrinomonadaceae bacterium]